MDQSLVNYFVNGLRQWGKLNLDAARDNIVYCIEALDDGQCDLHRALATLQGQMQDEPGPQLIDKIYETLPTWGRLLAAVSEETGSALPADYFPVTVDLGYLGLRFEDSRTRTGVHVGKAASLASAGRFDEALQVINAAPVITPMVQLATLLIHFKAARWQDVIDQGQGLLNPTRYDSYDQSTGITDTYLQAVAYLMTGISYAHLGNFVTASERLRTADTKQIDPHGQEFHYVGVGAEACYYLGLIERAKGDEDTAQVYWNNGLAYARTDKLVEALADPTVRLRQTTAELIKQRGSYWDVNTESDLFEVQQAERVENQSAMLAEADAVLMNQIGMEEVKAQVRRLKAAVAYEKEMARRGKTSERKALHLIFKGPPGTGKTTIARVILKMYVGMGLCDNDNLVEASRGDLVGSHEGESVMKTREVLDRADGGGLFLDEAYEIVQARNSGQVDPFGTEAMTELMREAENRRGRLIVIMAGYEADMNRLLATNDGLVSRFPRTINFHSYTPAEISQIAVKLAEARHGTLSEAGCAMFVDAAHRLQAINHAGKKMLDVAGNGRFVRNVVELAEEFRSERLLGTNLRALSDEELFELAPSDIAQAMNIELAKSFGVAAPQIDAPPAVDDRYGYNGGDVR